MRAYPPIVAVRPPTAASMTGVAGPHPSVDFMHRWAIFLVLFSIASCMTPGVHIPPGNRQQRGPNAMRTGTDYYTSHDFLIGAYHNTGFYRSVEEALTGLYMPLMTGLLYSRYTIPIVATASRTGPDSMSYAAICMFWIFCSSDAIIRPEARLKTIHAVDAEIVSVLLGIYSRRTIVFSGSFQGESQ